MNYLEAVKILVNDPKAVAITFPGKGELRRIVLELRGCVTESGRVREYHNLVFPATATKRKQNVVATSPEFLLREDFSIEYKEEKLYTMREIDKAYEKGVTVGEARERKKQVDARKIAAAARKFFALYKD